jgi:hypothetical protein
MPRRVLIQIRFTPVFLQFTTASLGLGLALSGCGPGESPSTSVADSADVMVVSSIAPQWQGERAWRMSERPELEIGGESVPEEYQFFQLASVLRLEDGRIIVGNRGTHELRYYDAGGRFLRAVGREGGGPGEFGRLWSIRRFGSDSLLIWDPVNYRYAVHDLDGNFGRNFKFQADSVGSVFFPGMDPVVFADRTFLGMAGIDWMSLPSGVVRETARYYRFDPSGELLSHVISAPFMEMKRLHFGEEGRATQTPVVFGKQTQMAAGDTVFWVGTADNYVLRQYRQDGRILREVRVLGVEPTLVTEAMVEQEVQRRLDASGMMGRMAPAAVEAFRKNLETMPIAEALPPYGDILVDAEGNLWVERYLLPGEEHAEWDVLDREGAWLGTLTLPPRFQLHEVGADYVLGVWLSDLDVEVIRLYGLTKT